MVEKISEGIWKINADSNIYIIKRDKIAVIDTCPSQYKDIILAGMKDICNPDDVDAVIYTHLHYDHAGNSKLFKNAKHFASAEELKSFKEDPQGTVLNETTVKELTELRLIALEDNAGKELLKALRLKIIDCPGHTKGSISLMDEKEGILFSGDTLFFKGSYGRTDLPTSIHEKMDDTLEMLNKKGFKILCPGHDY